MIHKQYTLYSGDPKKGTVCQKNNSDIKIDTIASVTITIELNQCIYFTSDLGWPLHIDVILNDKLKGRYSYLETITIQYPYFESNLKDIFLIKDYNHVNFSVATIVKKLTNATSVFRDIKKLNSQKTKVEVGGYIIHVNQTNEKSNRCGDIITFETHYYFTSDYKLLYKKDSNADYDR